MLKKTKLSIIEWFVLVLIMSIPLVNVIVLIWGLVKNKFSENIKNFVIAYIIFYFIFLGGLWQGGIF